MHGVPYGVGLQATDVGVDANYFKPVSFEQVKKEMDKNFEDYTWQDMENMVGELFEKKGYDVIVTQATGDFGIDVEVYGRQKLNAVSAISNA